MVKCFSKSLFEKSPHSPSKIRQVMIILQAKNKTKANHCSIKIKSPFWCWTFCGFWTSKIPQECSFVHTIAQTGPLILIGEIDAVRGCCHCLGCYWNEICFRKSRIQIRVRCVMVWIDWRIHKLLNASLFQKVSYFKWKLNS